MVRLGMRSPPRLDTGQRGESVRAPRLGLVGWTIAWCGGRLQRHAGRDDVFCVGDGELLFDGGRRMTGRERERERERERMRVSEREVETRLC